MNVEKAEEIIDTMYQNRFKEKEKMVDDGIFKGISIGNIQDVKFTEFEEASVRVLREEISLKKENTKLRTENTELKDKLNKIQDYTNKLQSSLK